jgi:hypothetical protein
VFLPQLDCGVAMYITLNTLPWKRNQLMLGRSLLVSGYRTTTKTVRPVKPVSTKQTLRLWVPSASTVISLNIPLMLFCLGRRYPYILEIRSELLQPVLRKWRVCLKAPIFGAPTYDG